MHAEHLNRSELELVNAYRSLPQSAKTKLFKTIEELTEVIEDESDAMAATQIISRIKSGEEEVNDFDDVVKQLGLKKKR